MVFPSNIYGYINCHIYVLYYVLYMVLLSNELSFDFSH